jgi:hypothetical protein
MVIERVNCWPGSQKILRIVAGTINSIDKSYFYFPIGERLLDQFDVFSVAADILNFAPTESDFTIDAKQ